MSRRDAWAAVNRCVVCGTKLVFLRSTDKDAKHDEGSKSCSHNHAKFQVYGKYDTEGVFRLNFVMPVRGKPRPCK